ncbi:MAG: hypothetical protein KGI41_03505 [Patescibacteria group bacterium]|nr:hypothetical protein [Patescibacteria group bacterium]MDE1966277.1 hypothetical protein [Patescibacteria group bacterium]
MSEPQPGAFEECADMTHEWMVRRPFRRNGKLVSVHAWQVPCGGNCATAKLAITISGERAHEADVPFPMPCGKVTLPYQVYLLSTQPDYVAPQYQPYMLEFARHCPDFSEKAVQVYWSEAPF